MKKIRLRKNVLSTAVLACAAFTFPALSLPAKAFDAPAVPQIIQEAGMQGGLNQTHDNNYLRERYQENYRNEDYQ